MNQLNVDQVADALHAAGLEVIDYLDAWWANDDRAEYAAFFVYDDRKQRLACETRVSLALAPMNILTVVFGAGPKGERYAPGYYRVIAILPVHRPRRKASLS